MPLGIPHEERRWDGEPAVRAAEAKVGHPFPEPYRSWAVATNGVRFPDGAGIPHTRLVGMNTLYKIKGVPGAGTISAGRVRVSALVTGDYLPIGADPHAFVLLKLTGPDLGSVWLLPAAYRSLVLPAKAEDGDPAEDDYLPVDLDVDFAAAGYGSLPEFLSAERLERVADDFDGFLSRLRTADEAIAARLADQRLAGR